MMSDDKKSKHPCGRCQNNCKTGCLQCSMCAVWYHNSCVDVPAAVLSHLGKVRGLFWNCQSCLQNPGETVPSNSLIETTVKLCIEKSLQPIKKSINSIIDKVLVNENQQDGTTPATTLTNVDEPPLGLRIRNMPEVKIPDNSDTKAKSEIMIKEREQVENVLQTLNPGCIDKITDVFRMGKYNRNAKFPRTIIVRMSSNWELRKTIANTFKLKGYKTETGNSLFVSRELSKGDLLTEKAILQKRYELINTDNIAKERIKIRGLKLFVDDTEQNAIQVKAKMNDTEQALPDGRTN